MKRSSVLVALALSLLSAPCFAEDTLAEPERYPPSTVRPKLIGGGIAITGIAYGVGFVAATSWPEIPGIDSLKYPIVGPWMALAKLDCSDATSNDCGSELAFRSILLGIGGIAQLGGIALITEALVMKTQAVAPTATPVETGRFVMPIPIITTHSAGIGLVGTF